MSISMYQASVPVFIRMLTNLSGILDKAAADAEARKIDPAVFLNARLAPDMHPFTRQVQIAADFAKGASARLAGLEVPKYEDNEASIAELKARIDKTIAFVKTIKPAQIDDSEERVITLVQGDKTRTFKGQAYLLEYVFAHFYFHATTAYAILRHNGVPVGKKDFVGPA